MKAALLLDTDTSLMTVYSNVEEKSKYSRSQEDTDVAGFKLEESGLGAEP